MKRLFRSIIASLLESQVKRLQKHNSFKTIAVVGSIGKTSTKLAVGRALSKVAKTRYQNGNYNHRVTVPLVFFGHKNPSSTVNVFAWLKILALNELQLRKNYPYEYVVVELGTDAPGDIEAFSYIDVELAIVTAIAPEHMEFFPSIDDVAREELSVARYAKHLLVNSDLCEERHIKHLDGHTQTYGVDKPATIQVTSSFPLEIKVQDRSVYTNKQHRAVKPKQYSLAAVIGVLSFVNMDDPRVVHALLDQELQEQTSGRLQILAGVRDATIIDDTYNASPEAVAMALEVLRAKTAPQKIAILGSMNELGSSSEASHKEIGQLCSPKDIDLLVTIGGDANRWLAPIARKNGCEVESFTNPYEAGMFVKNKVKNKAVILAKGSQNGVFAEEALKPLLKNEYDQKKLVRQSKQWLAKKRHSFEAKP